MISTADGKAAPYAFVQDVAASWQDYQRIAGLLADPVPAGLILHIAGPTDEGVRVIDLWENEQAWNRYRSDRLAPALAALAGPARSQASFRFRDLHPAQIVMGKPPTANPTRPKGTTE